MEEKVSSHLSPIEISIRYRLLLNAISNIENKICERSVCDIESYHYIPFPPSHFIDALLEGFFHLGASTSKKFIDIGCGSGLTVLIASGLFESYGFDYNTDLVDRARSFLGDSVFLDDAKTFDRYDEFDFIYYYRPFFDENMYFEFEERVFKSMKSGSLVCPIWESFDWPRYTKKIGKYVYQKL